MHWYPNQGDPFDWPIEDFDEAVSRIEAIERRKRGDDNTPLGRVVGKMQKYLSGR